MHSEKLKAALSYAARGLRVFPLIAGEKLPAIKWKEGASTDTGQLRRWFSDDAYNIGVIVPVGILALDLDCKGDVDGFKSLAALEAVHGPLPASPVQRSPSGSVHRWFKLPSGVFVGNSAGKIGVGIDVRSSRPDGADIKVGFVVAAPSRTEKGAYAWTEGLPDDLADLPVTPAWLIAAATAEKAKATTKPNKVSAVEVVGGEISAGGRNAALTKIAGAAHRQGAGVDSIVALLISENETRCSPPLDRADVETIARSICGYPIASDVALAVAPEDWRDRIADADGEPDKVVDVARGIVADPCLSATHRESLLKTCAKVAGVSIKVLRQDIGTRVPAIEGNVVAVVEVSRSDFAASVDQVCALLPTVPGLRQRGGELVELVPVPDRKSVTIQTVSAPQLTYLLACAARWSYGDAYGSPDPTTISAVMSFGYWPGVPPLAGLLHQPCVSTDGGLVSTPGYDIGTMREGIFDADAFPICTLSGDEAMKELRDLLTGYAFASAVDESAALAAILTAATRAGLPTAPGFMVSAGDFGSGKSHLAKLIALFAGGAVIRGWPRSSEEQGKVLITSLMQGSGAVLFDNMGAVWSGAAMAVVLSEPVYSDRLLGVNRNVEVSTACLWLATAVNGRPGADLMRRVLTIEIDARCERPWERKFDFDPIDIVAANRGRWVMLALRVLQDGAQRPCCSLAPLGGYGDWTATVRRSVVAFGLPDPVAALTRNAGEDGDRDTLSSLLALWTEAFPNEMLTLREVLQETASAPPTSTLGALRFLLLDIAGERGEVNAVRLGNWFSDNKGRVVDGRRLVKGEKKTDKGWPWFVVAV